MSRLLIVDDERVVTRGLEEDLTQMGYEVVGFASSGKEAIVKARILHPDLVLMDIVMPGAKDGIVAATEINAELNIPVVFLTAYSDLELVERAKWSEAFGYILKPVQYQQLRATIEMTLHKITNEDLMRDLMKVQTESLRELRQELDELKRSEEERNGS